MMQSESNQDQNKNLQKFYQEVLTHFRNQDQKQLALKIKQFYNDPAYNNANIDKWNFPNAFSNYKDLQLGQQFSNLLKIMREFQQVKAKKGITYAFKIHAQVLTAVIQIFEKLDSSNFWICKTLRQVVRASKKIYFQAAKMSQTGNSNSIVIKKDDLMQSLQRFKSSRNIKQDTKRQILPLIDNMQVSIMLTYHNYEQIKRILQPNKVYGAHGPKFQNNYFFQRGKLALISQDMLEAEKYFEQIKISTKGQKRLVLKYLIPCKMFLGKLFTKHENAEEEYFPQYEPIIDALKKSNITQYNAAILKYQKLWIKRGIYLLMDQLRKIVWRNLLIKVSKIKGTKIDMEDIQKAVKLSGGTESLNECICIVGNLIYYGYVKGYIYQNEKQRVLVLKKDAGFPKLSDIY